MKGVSLFVARNDWQRHILGEEGVRSFRAGSLCMTDGEADLLESRHLLQKWWSHFVRPDLKYDKLSASLATTKNCTVQPHLVLVE